MIRFGNNFILSKVDGGLMKTSIKLLILYTSNNVIVIYTLSGRKIILSTYQTLASTLAWQRGYNA